jgi:hypothetical protein
MRALPVLLTLWAASASATLPPAPEAAKQQAAENAAKSAWADKVAAYQLCLSQDRIAEAYRRDHPQAARPVPTPPCSDPGPYVSPLAQKPLEASGAHSPPATASTPPSTNATAAELTGSKKAQP